MNLPILWRNNRKAIFVWVITRSVAIILAASAIPPLLRDLYLPFVDSFLANPSIDPWSDWESIGMRKDAFPYGWTMLAFMATSYSLADLFGAPGYLGLLGMYLLADFAVFSVLLGWGPSRSNLQKRSGAFFYALAPAPIVLLGISGSNDFLPMLLLLLAVVLLVRQNQVLAGIVFGLAIGLKAILVVAAFAAVLFLFRDAGGRKKGLQFGLSALAVAVISLSPILYSAGLRASIASSDDAVRPLSWAVDSPGGSFYIVPILLGVVFFGIWQLKRMNQDLLISAVVAPLLVAGAIPGAPLGWSLWSLPLLVQLLMGLPRRFQILGYGTMVLKSASSLPDLGFNFVVSPGVIELTSLAVSFSFLLSLALAGLLWREYVLRSDFVRLRKRPSLVLISGDSGTGKDTLAEGICRVLGEDSCTHLSGDDYHLWDRGHGSWNYLTHLNPASNDLSKYFDAIIDLVSGKTISVGKYDHGVGRRLSSRAATGRSFVVSSGLHALWSKDVNSLASLKVFLSMSDDLRLDLKLSRDVNDRGHSVEAVMRSVDARKPDYVKYISPQEQYADLSVHSSYVSGISGSKKSFQLEFSSYPKIFDATLVSELIQTCGLEARLEFLADERRVMRVIGSTTPELLSWAFQRIEPVVFDVIGPGEKWSSGPAGIVQLVALVYLANALRRERLIE